MSKGRVTEEMGLAGTWLYEMSTLFDRIRGTYPKRNSNSGETRERERTAFGETQESPRILRSAIHRVVAPPGEQRKFTRHSICCFTRPNDDARLLPLSQSPTIAAAAAASKLDLNPGATMKEWVQSRVKSLKMYTKMLGHKSIEESVGTAPADEKTADKLAFLLTAIKSTQMMS